MERLSPTFDLIQILGRIGGVKILCVGDVMLDRYVYGAIDRISPEAPIPVMQYQNQTAMLGGAGNVARNLCAWNANVTLLSVSGRDEASLEIKNLAAALPGLHLELFEDSSRPTTVKTRYVSGNQQIMRLDAESRAEIGAALCEKIASRARQAVKDAKAVILSDYAKGLLNGKLAQDVIRAAREAGVPVLVDPKGGDYTRYQGAFAVSPNLKELGCGHGDQDVEKAGTHMMQTLNLSALLATRGKDGMTVLQKNQKPLHLSAMAREVYDVSGAGDTSIAMLAAAMATGADFADAAYLANIAAGIVVGKLGTSTAQISEIDEALMRQQGGLANKLYDVTALIDRIAVWRRQGHSIGFTNGCFDLIHPGHVSLLRQSRAACGKLIVALNTDASVKKLKGPARPIQNETSRATVMSSFDSVDAVVLFDEDTPMKLIEAIRPDVLVKGADYTVATVVGSDFVQSYGGKILLVKLEEGHSTTGTVKKIAAS